MEKEPKPQIQSSESAPQTVGGATMSPPSFGLEASAGQQCMAAAGPGFDLEAAVANITADGQILRTFQQEIARTNLRGFSPGDQESFVALLDQDVCTEFNQYLYKALAAGHPLSAIRTFADAIRGKDSAWMQDNLQLTGDTSGNGVRQQWSFSCNATAVQTVRGELDPIYALATNTANPDLHNVDESDATSTNPALAEEQRAMLESPYGGTRFGAHTGVASDVNDPASGSGRWADDLLNGHSASTGLSFAPQLVGAGMDISVADAITAIDAGLGSGMPVPIVVGSGVGVTAHYVVITRVTEVAGVRTYTIHNPGDGKTTQVALADLQNGNMNLSGWTTLTAIENPSLANP
jgi:hypothetical protein